MITPTGPLRSGAVLNVASTGSLYEARESTPSRSAHLLALPSPLLPVADRSVSRSTHILDEGLVMNCFTCATSDRSTAAIASCTSCGAGVCPEHARVDAHERPYSPSPGIHTPHVVRAFICPDCAVITSGSRALLPSTGS